MVEAIEDPGEEGVHFEEHAFLAEAIELRVAVEEPGGDELVEDSHYDGGKDGEEDVVKGESPGFEDYFAREGVLEGILYAIRLGGGSWRKTLPRIVSCTRQYSYRMSTRSPSISVDSSRRREQATASAESEIVR